MNRIDFTFKRLRSQQQSALVPFLTAGDPDLGTTLELMRAAADAGADLIEIGAPFSDPTSDGPVLQRSSEVSLKAGTSLPRVLETVAQFRLQSQIPVILYGYYNPIFRYGAERFARDAAQVGIDGTLVVDLPPEEAAELLPSLRAQKLHLIALLTPTSDMGRVRAVLRVASGFIYYVSVTGVTGVRAVDVDSVRPAVEDLRQWTRLPIGVGFGISTPDQATAVASFADATVVGSAIMRLVDQCRGSANLVADVAAFIGGLSAAVRQARRGASA